MFVCRREGAGARRGACLLQAALAARAAGRLGRRARGQIAHGCVMLLASVWPVQFHRPYFHCLDVPLNTFDFVA